MLAKVFPIKLKPGNQAAAEAIVADFAPKGPAQELGTISFRVYKDPYKENIAGKFAKLVVDFVELDHQLLVSI